MQNALLIIFIGLFTISATGQCPINEFEKTIKLPTNTNVEPKDGDFAFINYDDFAVWFCFPRIIINEWQKMGFYSFYPPGGIQVDTLVSGPGKEVYVDGIFNILQLSMDSSILFTTDNSRISITNLKVNGTENYLYLGEGTILKINHEVYSQDEYSPDGINKVHILPCLDFGQLSTFPSDSGIEKSDTRTFDMQGKLVTDPQPLTPYIRGKKKFMILN